MQVAYTSMILRFQGHIKLTFHQYSLMFIKLHYCTFVSFLLKSSLFIINFIFISKLLFSCSWFIPFYPTFGKAGWLCIIWQIGYCIGGNLNIHIWAWSASPYVQVG